MPNTRTRTMATQKYGIAEVITNTGGTTLSSFPPRHQAERPPDRAADDRRDRRRELAQGGAEVTGQHLVQVAEVLREQALLIVDPEEGLQGLQRLRVGARRVELRHHGQRWVAWHQPRQQEVDGKRRPQRQDEETEAAQRVSQARWLLVQLTWAPRARASRRFSPVPGTRRFTLLRRQV